MKKLAEFMIKNRMAIILLTAILTLFFALQIPKLKIDPDVINYLPKDDIVAQHFDSIGQSYGGNTVAVIGYRTENVFTHQALMDIKAITDTLKNFKGVSSVTSLINVIDIREEDSILQVVPLIDENDIPEDAHVLDSIRKYVLSKEMYRGLLISDDASSTVLTVYLEPNFVIKPDSAIAKDSVLVYYKREYPEPFYELNYHPSANELEVVVNKTNVVNAIKEKLNESEYKDRLFFGGLPYMISDIGSIIGHDIITLGILAFLIILIVLYLSFKSWRGVLMPVLAVGIAICWVLGMMALIGVDITMITNATPVVLLATGSAYTIHVINRIVEELYREQKSLKEVIVQALTYVIVPVFFAALTTMIGFISFIFGSYLVIISHFGIFTAIGVLFSFIIAITFVPAFLSYFPFKNIEKRKSEKENAPLNKFLNRLFRWTFEHKKSILTAWLLILIFFVTGIFRIERRVDLMDYFKENYPTKKTEKFLRETFGGTAYLYVNVKGDMQNLEVLSVMDSVQEFIKSFPEVTHTLSVVDLLKEMNNVMGEGKQLPNQQDKVYNLWFLIEGQDIMSHMVASGNTEGLITATLNTTDSKVMSNIVEQLEKVLKKYKVQGVEMYQSGYPALYHKLDLSLINSQMYSLLIAVLLVLVIVSFLLKSISNGFITIVPILTTVVVLFGFMGWLHIPLDIATVLVASVSMGIGIDYAIHLINHVTHERKLGATHYQSIERAVTISGRAIIINVVSVMLGFIVMLFSDLVPLQRFGLLIAVTMIASGLSTLTLLVTLLNIKNQKKLSV